MSKLAAFFMYFAKPTGLLDSYVEYSELSHLLYASRDVVPFAVFQ